MTDSDPVLLCDLDGTLIDSAPDLTAAVARLLSEMGRVPLSEDAVRRMVGDGVPKLIERALAASGGAPEPDALAGIVERYLPIYESMMTARTRPYPGAAETLGELKAAGWRLAVCTNKPERPTRGILAALGLAPLFEAVAGGDTFAVRKPDPGHVFGLLAAMSARPADAVMLGDGANDVRVARAAGLPVIAVASGYGPVPVEDLDPDIVIAGIAELPRALERLGRRPAGTAARVAGRAAETPPFA